MVGITISIHLGFAAIDSQSGEFCTNAVGDLGDI